MSFQMIISFQITDLTSVFLQFSFLKNLSCTAGLVILLCTSELDQSISLSCGLYLCYDLNNNNNKKH